MSERICANCKWWGDPYDVALRNGFVKFGHCEPDRHVGNPHPINVVQRHHFGLTAGDYTCGEWREKTDDG